MALTHRAARALQSRPQLYRIARGAWSTLGDALPPRHVDGIDGPVHRNDLMFASRRPEGVRHYRDAAESAVELCAEALRSAGIDDVAVDAVLDLGCGHGRVTRALVRRFGAPHVTACDVDQGAVRWVARSFGARPLFGSLDRGPGARTGYDVIWMGSVVTHLAGPDYCGVLERAAAHLRPGGVVVLTTQGPALIEELAIDLPHSVGRARRELQRAVEADGFGYVAYSHVEGGAYGMAFHTPGRVVVDAATLELRHLFSRSCAWGNQDVHAFVRPSTP